MRRAGVSGPRLSRNTGRMKRIVVMLAAGAVLALAWLALKPPTRSSLAPARDTLAVAPVVADRSPEYPDTALEARLRSIVSGGPGRVAIVAKHLETGAVARVNGDALIPLLSVVKLPVALVILDEVDQGRMSLSTRVTLLSQDMHPRGELGDRYPRGGGPVPLHRLLKLMIERSDNTAADALMRLVGGPPAVTEWLRKHGIHDLRVDRTERGLGNDWYGLAAGQDAMASAEDVRELRSQVPDVVHDSAALAMLVDPRDTGTAEACVHLLERLWRGELLSATMTDTLKAWLEGCDTAPRRLPAMLPRGTRVARKTGTGGTWQGVTVAINDVGVIRLPNGEDVAIAVLVGEPRGSVRRAEKLIARVARAVFEAWSGEDHAPGQRMR